MPFPFRAIPEPDLNRSLRDRFMELHDLIERYCTDERPSHNAVLRRVSPAIRQNQPIVEWQAELVRDLLRTGSHVGREALLNAISNGDRAENEFDRVSDLANWLVNVAVIVNDALPGETALEASGLLVMTDLAQSPLDGSPDEYIESTVSTLANLIDGDDSSRAELDQYVRLHAAMVVAKLSERDGVEDTWRVAAVNWCSDLLRHPQHVNVLSDTARILDVPLPEPAEKPSNDESSPQAQEAISPQPELQIWPSPRLIPKEKLDEECQSIRSELVLLKFDDEHPLHDNTVKNLDQLANESDPSAYSSVLYFAESQLWNGYWQSGNSEYLDLARRVALLSLSLELGIPPEQDDRERYRLNVLSVWMNVQLPTLIQVSDPVDIVTDAARLGRSFGIEVREQYVREGIIEAHAGLARQLKLEGDLDSWTDLLRGNGESLKQVYRDYLHFSRAAQHPPHINVTSAWGSLFPDEDDETEDREDTILADPNLGAALRSGSGDRVFQFIETQLSDIVTILIRRLDARLTKSHLMPPEGIIYNPAGQKRNQAHYLFEQAQAALQDDNFSLAAELLEQLSNQVQLKDRPRQICRNHLAYAHSMKPDFLTARLILSEITKADFHYPSAYWNEACMHDDVEAKLSVLARGLVHAPHPHLLRGAISQALLLRDEDEEGRITFLKAEHLREWLPRLTLAEALLLSYYLDYEHLSSEERDIALYRLLTYVDSGEPTVPNPTENRIRYRDAETFLTDLISRKQFEAAEWWLACREPGRRRRFDYWSLKVDFHRLANRPGDTRKAALAFKEELRCRLDVLDKSIPANNPNKIRTNAEQWLRHCATDKDIEQIGHDIYRLLVAKSEEADDEEISDDIRRLRESIKPRRKDVLEFYATRSNPESAEEDAESLEVFIARVGGECNAYLHEVEHIIRVRTSLTQLQQALRNHGRTGSADALQALLRAWDSYGMSQGMHERQSLLEDAQHAYARLIDAWQKDLTPDELNVVSQLKSALERVNARLARALELLPELRVEPVADDVIEIDDGSDISSISVRIRRMPGYGETPVRLIGAIATLNTSEKQLPLRDQLAELPIIVEPEGTVVVSFEKPRGLKIDRDQTVRIVVRFEYGGAEVETDPVTLRLDPRSCPPLPTESPYIFGRVDGLEPHEMEEHFFGRDSEIEELLSSIQAGQQRIPYIEGIRRTGKSSLLKSLIYEIQRRELPIIPVFISIAAVSAVDRAGLVLHNILDGIASDPAVADAGVVVPDEELCCSNMPMAYTRFLDELANKLPDQRVLVLADNFQAFVEHGSEAHGAMPEFSRGLKHLAEVIHEHANPGARLLWVLAGHRAQRQFRELMPNVLLWANLTRVRIDFLRESAIEDIITTPLRDGTLAATLEACKRVYWLTQGHPEIAQELAHMMFIRAGTEKRTMITPADADEAAYEIAKEKDFTLTWYSLADLTREQRSLMAAYVQAVGVGGHIEINRLVPNPHVTDAQKQAIDDLQARNIMDYHDGRLSVRAPILDLWLHKALPDMIVEGFNGAAGIFVDLPNLTDYGRGGAVISGLNTIKGEDGIPGQFRVETILNRIKEYSSRFTPVPITIRYVTGWPPQSPALNDAISAGFSIEAVDERFTKDHSDDLVLSRLMRSVDNEYAGVNHFIVVTGDKHYEYLNVRDLLNNGKFVHIVSREGSLSGQFSRMADDYPERVTVKTLEEILEESEEVAPA